MSVPSLTIEQINAMKVANLRKELKDRGVNAPSSAKKNDLVQLLRSVIESEGGSTSVPSSQPVSMTKSTDDLISQTLKELEATPVVNIAQSISAPQPSSTTTPSTNGATNTSNSTNTTSKVIKLSKSSMKPSTTASSTSTSTSGVVVPAVKKVTAVSNLDPKERLAARAARFGSTGSTSTTTSTSATKVKEPILPTIDPSTPEQLEALKKRSERFGEVVSNKVKSLEEKSKLIERAKRFNLSEKEVNPVTKLGLKVKVSKSSESESGTKVTTTKRTSTEEDERLKKRRERFGLVA